jgi:hypothetical protein
VNKALILKLQREPIFSILVHFDSGREVQRGESSTAKAKFGPCIELDALVPVRRFSELLVRCGVSSTQPRQRKQKNFS